MGGGYPPMKDISGLVRGAAWLARSSEYRSVRWAQVERIIWEMSASEAPARRVSRRLRPSLAKRQVKRRPSEVRRARVQVVQNGRVTEGMTPMMLPAWV